MDHCHLSRIRKNVLPAALAASLIAACSSSSDSDTIRSDAGDAPICAAPSGCGTPDPATTQLDSPKVSFTKDVVPIFQRSCSLSTACHSAQGSEPSGLYLGGPANMPADPAGIVKATVNVKSMELPTMNYVTPGDLGNSYLMHKMDGDACQLTTCSSSPVSGCGVVMPLGGCALPGSVRDTVRRWIAQGANQKD